MKRRPGWRRATAANRATGCFPASRRRPLARSRKGPPGATEQTSASTEAHQIWQLHNRYLLYPTETGLSIIDQHVAHERILFERAMRSFENENMSSQQLLFPQIVDLTLEEQSYFKEILPFLEKIGYIVKEFSKFRVMCFDIFH